MRKVPSDVRLLLRLLPPGEEGEVVAGDIVESIVSGDREGMGLALRLQVLRSLWALWRGRPARTVRRMTGAMVTGCSLDLATAVRLFRRRPALAVGVTASIALGVAATTTGMAFREGVLGTPLPYPDPGGMVRVAAVLEDGQRLEDLSVPDIEALGSIPDLAAAVPVARVRMVVPAEGGAYRLRGEAVGKQYAALLEPQIVLGSFLGPRDFDGGEPSRIVLSERVWRSRFGGDERIVGSTIRSDATLHEVVGVASMSFFGTTQEDVIDFWAPITAWAAWETIAAEALMNDPGERWVRAVGRMAGPRVPREGRTLGAFPATSGLPPGARVLATPLSEEWLSAARDPLRLLAAAAVCLLLLAVVNVTALMGARLMERKAELGVRLALGASKGLVVRGLLTEAFALSLLGSLAGTGLALLVGPPVGDLLLTNVVLFGRAGPRIGPGTVGLVASVSLALALGAALLPPLLLRRTVFRIVLDQVRGSGRALPTRLLNGAQVAIATVFLIGTGLLLRSYSTLSQVDLGYRTEGILRMQVTAADATYPTPEARRTLAREVVAAVRAEPGVLDAVLVGPSAPPFAFLPAALTVESAATNPSRVDLHSVSEGFFRVLDIETVAGSDLDDVVGTEPTAIVVSRTVAERLGGPRAVVGMSADLRVAGGEPVSVEIVGVAEDVMYTGGADLRPAPLDVYVPIEQWPRTFFTILVDHRGRGLGELVPGLQRSVGQVDPAAALHWIEPMTEVMGTDAVGLGRRVVLIGLLAGLALAMAGVGLYAQLTYSGRRRRGEFAIRRALGATPGRVGRMVMLDGLASMGGGLLAGLGLAVVFVRAIGSFLYGVTPADPLTLLAVSALLMLVGLVAATGPARSASRPDLAEALNRDS